MRLGVWLLVFAAAAILAGCGGSARTPSFEPAAGWHVLVEPGQTVSAANMPFARADRSESVPNRTIAALTHDGVVIWVESIRGDDRAYRAMTLPLRVQDPALPGGLEGTGCPPPTPPDCSRHLQAHESGWDADVWIFFGGPKRTAAQNDAANAELARLRFGS